MFATEFGALAVSGLPIEGEELFEVAFDVAYSPLPCVERSAREPRPIDPKLASHAPAPTRCTLQPRTGQPSTRKTQLKATKKRSRPSQRINAESPRLARWLRPMLQDLKWDFSHTGTVSTAALTLQSRRNEMKPQFHLLRGELWRRLGLRARTSRYCGLPSSRRPRAANGRVLTVNPDAVRSSRTACSGQVR